MPGCLIRNGQPLPVVALGSMLLGARDSLSSHCTLWENPTKNFLLDGNTGCFGCDCRRRACCPKQTMAQIKARTQLDTRLYQAGILLYRKVSHAREQHT